MRKLLKNLPDRFKNNKDREEPVIEEKLMTVDAAGEYIQEVLSGESVEILDVFNEAVAGSPGARERAVSVITDILDGHRVVVEGMTSREAAEIVYRDNWGLETIQELYDDPAVSEIRWNNLKLFVTRKGRKEAAGIFLTSPAQAERIVKRLLLHDVGVSLNETSPRAYSVRKDGSRVTALCYPVSPAWANVIRKHNTFDMSPENLEKHGTMDVKTYMRIRLLYVGGANIIIIGPADAGKTSLLRKIVGELPEYLRIISLSKDREILMSKEYPDRDILELEEHEELGVPMPSLFETILTLSPDVIIVEELKGYGEATETIKACTRGHRHSGTTAHFNNAVETVEGIGMMMIEEGLNLPLELAMLRVARAFNLVIRMKKCNRTGVKKLVDVTEIGVNGGKVFYRPLIEWVPDDENDNYGSGCWVPVNMPTDELLSELEVSRKEVAELWSR